MEVTIRRAVSEDRALLYQWRNLPEIVSLGTTRSRVTPQEHGSWFKRMVRSKDHKLFIINRGRQPVGQIRFDLAPGRRQASVSVYLRPESVGHGYGTSAIRMGCWEVFATGRVDAIYADIVAGNRRSVAAFSKAGFRPARPRLKRRDGQHRLMLSAPDPVAHNRVEARPLDTSAAERVIRSGAWATGEQVRILEGLLQRHFNFKHAVCVASGLGAIRLALVAAGVNRGDRVVAPAYCCVALANAILSLGAKPVPVDVDASWWNLDPSEVSQAILRIRPRAILTVSTFGAPSAMEHLKRFGIPVIEDSSHGPGTPQDRGRKDLRPDAVIMSFYATKLLGAGMGGVVLTDSDSTARAVRDWREYDEKPADARRLNERMTDVSAALAIERLKHLKRDLAGRLSQARRYHRLLRHLEAEGLCRLPAACPGRAWYRYAVESLAAPAAALVTGLARYGIGTARPVSEWVAHLARYPNAHRAHETLLSLPLHPALSREDQERTAHALTRVLLSHGSVT